MNLVNKRIFLAGLTCLTKAWYLRANKVQNPLTEVGKFRIEMGNEIGKMARTLYPQGLLVDEGSNDRNYEKTKLLMNDTAIHTIFEATFIHNDNIAKADILARTDGGWHLIEVKSNAAPDENNDAKDNLIDDLAYTAFLLSMCGIEPEKASLLLVSKNYRLGMENRDFFVEVNCTEEVNKRRIAFNHKRDEILKITGMANRPDPTLIFQCKDCDFYKNECLGKNIDNSIFDLPRINEKKFNGLIKNNIFQINQIPDDRDLSATQKPVWNAVKDNTPSTNKEKLIEMLEKIIYPAYYLDFECVSNAIPLYQNIAPFEEIVTQYSIHKFSDKTSNDEHFEFLADYTKDDRKALAEQLLIDIGKEGSVIVYHAAAEKRFINNLAIAVPNLADELNSIVLRIVDLKDIIAAAYYHPAFHGSYSIKVVLPVLVPEMSYKNLIIGDGQSATIVFAELARGKYSTEEAKALCNELLKYCCQDTLAMVKIHEQLISLCN